MAWIEILRWLHMIGATILLGTGAGIAFFMLMAHRSRDVAMIAHTAGIVVIADYIFTASAVIAQPVTGYLLARALGWSLTEGWLLISLILYGATGALWLPVVFMQKRMRDLARDALRKQHELPPEYFRRFRLWFAFGVPAFLFVLIILWLMTNRPVIAIG